MNLVAVLGLAFCAVAGDGDAPFKVLMLTKSSGFEHSVVHRKGDQLSMAEAIVTDLGKKNGFEVTATKDASQVNAEFLKGFDVLYCFTQGDLTKSGVDRQPAMDPANKQAIIDFVAAGGGFVGTHCGGADTFHEWVEGDKKPYLDMVGGEFIGHGPQQVGNVEVKDPTFAAVKHWPKVTTLTDEWYAYQGFHGNMRVLMELDTSSLKHRKPLYDRASYPITWCSQHDKGRVFYTGMGHREDVWENEAYQKMVAEGIRWAAGKSEGSAEPNLKELYGDEATALERINPPKK